MTSFSRKSKPPSSLLDPAVYGRSTLENSSFIASTVNPDPHAWTRFRGKAERIDGRIPKHVDYDDGRKKVFRYEGSQLQLHLNPVLPAWLFDENQKCPSSSLGCQGDVSQRARAANTYGQDGVTIQRLTLTTVGGDSIEVDGPLITGELAHEVRNGNIRHSCCAEIEGNESQPGRPR